MKFKDELDMLSSLGGTSQDTSDTAIAQPEVVASPTSGISGLTTATEEKALQLLGAGVQSSQVAAALGVTPSRIAQLLSDTVFADKVASLRYENLQKHNRRDEKYDSLEDKLLGKLEKALPLLVKPESILGAMKIVNGAKRRGQSSPEAVGSQQTIANLVLPSVVVNKFSVDINNQVTKAGDQELLTMPSGNLLKRVEDAAQAVPEALIGGSNVQD